MSYTTPTQIRTCISGHPPKYISWNMDAGSRRIWGSGLQRGGESIVLDQSSGVYHWHMGTQQYERNPFFLSTSPPSLSELPRASLTFRVFPFFCPSSRQNRQSKNRGYRYENGRQIVLSIPSAYLIWSTREEGRGNGSLNVEGMCGYYCSVCIRNYYRTGIIIIPRSWCFSSSSFCSPAGLLVGGRLLLFDVGAAFCDKISVWHYWVLPLAHWMSSTQSPTFFLLNQLPFPSTPSSFHSSPIPHSLTGPIPACSRLVVCGSSPSSHPHSRILPPRAFCPARSVIRYPP